MAEAPVSFVIERLRGLLIQKIVFPKDVRGQVDEMQKQLVEMKCFLKDADERQDEDANIGNWVSQIRLAAYDAEDVIDTFIIKAESSGRKGLVRKLACFPKRSFSLDKVGKDIELIQARIRDIEEKFKSSGKVGKDHSESRQRSDKENLEEGSSSSAARGDHRLPRSSHSIEEGSRSSATRSDQEQQRRRLCWSLPLIEYNAIVGLGEKTNSLVEELLKEERRLRVVSIVGNEGVGKTTLARMIFSHPKVSARFDFRAWVCISQSYDYKSILGAMIMHVNGPTDLPQMLEKMQEEDLEKKLRRELQNKRYLVVLDDIWKEEDWNRLAKAFPEGGHGSRLLITTRKTGINLCAGSRSFPYPLAPLGQEESWALFVKTACGDAGRLSGLENIGREIASRCVGLPLAITAIGGLLRTKRLDGDEWRRVLNNINTHLKNQAGVSNILELSYSDLPPQLKSCFLYFGLFPADYEIQSRKLIHMWIAEGLVQQNQTEDLEGVAADYLDELISRNMVQVASASADKRVKRCRVHDSLRDLAIRKAKEEMFLELHGVKDTQISANCRHCAVHCHSKNYNFSAHSAPHLRSFLFFPRSVLFFGFDVRTKIRGFEVFQLLRVLDLQDMNVKTLPKEIGYLRLLGYLGLRWTRIKKLPESLGQLQSLQTLDIATPFSTIKVPNLIWKLQNLRHLYMKDIKCSEPLKMETLTNLRTLSYIRFDHILHNNLLSLTNLQKLEVIVDTDAEAENLINSIAKLGKLRSLSLRFFPSFVGLSNLSQLTELKIRGRLRMINCLQLPANLSQISLKSTHLNEDPMPILEKLEHLSVLKLVMAYRGRKMMISEKGFPELKFLQLRALGDLEEISVGNGGMSKLRCLQIIGCHNLKMFPEEVKNMSALEKVQCVGVHEEFVSRLQSVDAYKVSKVPNVILKERWNVSLE